MYDSIQEDIKVLLEFVVLTWKSAIRIFSHLAIFLHFPIKGDGLYSYVIVCWDLISHHHWDVRLVSAYVFPSPSTYYTKTSFSPVVRRDIFLFQDAFWHGATWCPPIQEKDTDIKMIREKTPERKKKETGGYFQIS